jgi:hypothetical protein
MLNVVFLNVKNKPFMLSVARLTVVILNGTYKPFVLSVVGLTVVILNGTYKPFVLSVVMLSVAMLNVIMLFVAAPFFVRLKFFLSFLLLLATKSQN